MKYSEGTLIEVYKAQHERFHQSRNNQWKINVTFWTLIVLAIFYKSKLPVTNFCWTLLICSIFFILHLFFVIKLQQNLQTDKKIWLDIIKYWNNEWPKDREFKIDTTSVKIKDLEPRAWFWILFQIAFTSVLLLI